MNDKVMIQNKAYDIVRVEENGVNVILRDVSGNEFASNAGAILLKIYTDAVFQALDTFDNVSDMKRKIVNVDEFLRDNGAYKKIHQLLPLLILPSEIVEKRSNDLCREFEKRKVSAPVEEINPVHVVEEQMTEMVAEEKQVEPVQEVEPVVNVMEDVFISVRDVNPMLINHDQKILRSYLMSKYPDYEVNEEFTIARNPHHIDDMYYLSINDSGEPQMISTKRNLKEEIANTPALTEAEILALENMSINELREERKKTSNLLKVNKINEIIAARKMGSEFDETVVVDQDFFAKMSTSKRASAFGFVSNLTLSFLFGVFGGVVLMVVGNAIASIL